MSILNRATQGNFPTTSRVSNPPLQWERLCSGCLQLPKLERHNSHSPVHEQEHRGNSHDSTVTTQFSGTSRRCSESPGDTYLASHNVRTTSQCPPSTCSKQKACRKEQISWKGRGGATHQSQGGWRQKR